MPAVENQLLGFVRRRRTYVVAAVVCAAAGAALLAPKFTAVTWTYGATLLYNRTMLGAPHYQQPEVQVLAALAKSRPVVEAVARDFDVPPTALKALADSVTADVVPGSAAIQLTMRGGDPQRTQAMLDRLLRAIIEQAGKLRRDAIGRILAVQERHLVEARRAADEARAALRQFNTEHGVVTSVADDLERVRDDLATAELAAQTDRAAGPGRSEELQRRRAAVQDRLAGRRDVIARDTDLALKKNAYERTARLHAKRYVSDAELQRAEAEYRAAEAEHGEALEAMRRQLAELDRELAEALRAESEAPAGAAPTQRVRAFLETRRRDAERLNGLRDRAAELQRNADRAQAEVDRLTALTATYAELADDEHGDLAIVQPAAPALDPIASTGRKTSIGLFVVLFALLLAPPIAADVYGGLRGRTAPVDALDGVPVTASVGDAVSYDEAIRTLALRLQQAMPDGGGAALIVEVDDEPATDVVADVAECLVRRGEKVLVVQIGEERRDGLAARFRPAEAIEGAGDAVVRDWSGAAGTRPAESSGRTAVGTVVADRVGLVDFLDDVRLAPDDVVRRGRTFDLVAVGDRPLPEEACAGRRLSELIFAAKSRYTIVLVAGPAVERTIDVEMLAARVDVTALIGRRARRPGEAASRTLARLAALRAPLLGITIV